MRYNWKPFLMAIICLLVVAIVFGIGAVFFILSGEALWGLISFITTMFIVGGLIAGFFV